MVQMKPPAASTPRRATIFSGPPFVKHGIQSNQLDQFSRWLVQSPAEWCSALITASSILLVSAVSSRHRACDELWPAPGDLSCAGAVSSAGREPEKKNREWADETKISHTDPSGACKGPGFPKAGRQADRSSSGRPLGLRVCGPGPLLAVSCVGLALASSVASLKQRKRRCQHFSLPEQRAGCRGFCVLCCWGTGGVLRGGVDGAMWAKRQASREAAARTGVMVSVSSPPPSLFTISAERAAGKDNCSLESLQFPRGAPAWCRQSASSPTSGYHSMEQSRSYILGHGLYKHLVSPSRMRKKTKQLPHPAEQQDQYYLHNTILGRGDPQSGGCFQKVCRTSACSCRAVVRLMRS
ncbi:hypothetical protein BT67DRAFT_184483 [Trichocladium antarcticum]|uniref:Uncharacterized protein n=1 Tax=Trichocladium antarcticum TaxID=1450529 RepID=A0AAN6UP25_9PEZI|nr:hypothetical protein BT67DRAFT_184483 [Trichocladium antarcticum]